MSVLLGVVNVFSDIVSYIRLWAVGLAGSAISATVNDMAGPILGGAVIFLGILLLTFGHGLNMVLNVLSVIVHGVRLNTLEFSSHLGMSWSGFAYEPFKETVENTVVSCIFASVTSASRYECNVRHSRRGLNMPCGSSHLPHGLLL